MDIINTKIKEIREDLIRISREQFAEETGMDLERLIRIEEGKQIPNVEDVVKVSTAYNISTDYIMGNRRLPAPILCSKEAKKLWEKLELLPDHELWEVCRKICEDFGLDIDREDT